MTEAIVFPVGHYTGTLYAGLDAPLQYHSLRIGRFSITISDEQAFAVWAAAHRPLEMSGRRWTREAVAETAVERLGVADAVKIMDEYLDDGILVDLVPGSEDAVGFAKAHRVVPIMLGLGNTPEEPLHYGIGLPGAAPVLTVPTLVYDVWQWGSVGDDLWSVCTAFAQAGADAQVSDEREQDPEYVLAVFLEWLQALVGVNAAYIDESRR